MSDLGCAPLGRISEQRRDSRTLRQPCVASGRCRLQSGMQLQQPAHPGVGVVEGHSRDLQSGHLVRSCTQDASLGSAALLLRMRPIHSMHQTAAQMACRFQWPEVQQC